VPALGGCAAVALLPDAGLPAAEAALTAPVLDGLLARLDEPAARTRVELRMPRFAVRAAAGLVEPLRTLGVHRAFSADADLSGLVGGLRARISEVRHEAVLRVDESGLEGAAATAVMIARAAFAREDPPVPVRLDRPFLLLVRHQRSGVIYFLARVTEP
jgi:serpin B